MREVVLDTETTGLSPQDGDRVFEIGALELADKIPTGRSFHVYLNPQRELSQASIRITGMTDAQLTDKPLFADVVEDFMAFLGEDPIVAHNADFDIRFLNHELGLLGQAELANEIVDTLQIARKKFPGSRHSLDALCQRFDVDLSERNYHGALLDARLLADVYMELFGGRQITLMAASSANGFAEEEEGSSMSKKLLKHIAARPVRPARAFQVPAEELAAHGDFLAQHVPNSLWHSGQEDE